MYVHDYLLNNEQAVLILSPFVTKISQLNNKAKIGDKLL